MNPKTVIITGSSRGIGKAIAKEFGNHHYQLVINAGHNETALYQTVTELRSLGIDCHPFFGDISQENTANALIQEALSVYGNIDCLINNAGISHIGLLTDMSLSDWNRIIQTNLTSAFLCCKAVLPTFLHKKEGRIVNISSVWGTVGASCEVAYSASKGGLNTFTKALARELAPSGIAVNAVACGMIDTAMNACFNQDEISAITDEIPAGRMGTCEEAAQLVYQTSELPSYVTGQIITIDGGWQ
ncbi:MAG: elongation factor P 5-aminopentanone reductase [Lachnospiraceae bacterium]